ncbi:28S ribosomal protein S15, mitochondrial [Homalodisca vitripennis]|uniref:Small ribosomal subunit protein uS15m n=1 Tax=Homalodisca liturata TaxID=320908 RepID=A0A1B6IK28_9HEMI|nr:28S ribosomal protein S15, mitochondrial [Homalodisca vitripennis]
MALVSNIIRHNIITINKNYLISTVQPTRNFKSALKIKWVRPEPIPCIKPEMSGDLAPLGTLDMTQYPTKYKSSKELQSAEENVQRIHTLEFFHRNVLKEEFLTQYIDRVKAHQLDDSSPEVKLAKLTVTIRNLQIHMAKFPTDKVNKVRLKESIDKRNKHLTRLRLKDYKKFEWLLEKLDLQYKVIGFGCNERVERKKSLRRLTALFIEKLKAERLAEYKAFLDSQKESFLKEKLEKFIWMKKSEEEFGVTPTITESDIETVRKQLQDLLQVNKPKPVAE